MQAGSVLIDYPAETSPKDVLLQFVGVFSTKGWLNKSLRIRHLERKYRVFCSENEFLAYRIQDCEGIPSDISGLPVCIVKADRILEDENISGFASTEPSAYEWLQRLADKNIEVI